MLHTIKMSHQLTKDEKNVFMSFEENGHPIYVSEERENTKFHLAMPDGGIVPYLQLGIFDVTFRRLLYRYDPTGCASGDMGFFVDDSEQEIGRFYSVGSGQDQYFVAEVLGKTYKCYPWTHRLNPCMMIYRDEEQVGMLVEDPLSHNRMFSMTLHLLRDEDQALLCIIAYAYHDVMNVHNTRSAYYRRYHDRLGGPKSKYYTNEANYHLEYQMSGVGEAYYHPEFLRPFYPEGSEMVEEIKVTPSLIASEMKKGMKESVGEAFSTENVKKNLIKDPLAIVILVGVAILCCLIGVFVGYATAGLIGAIIGFLIMAVIIGGSYGLFFLLVYVVWKNFGKKG